ncbi:LLM class flavin-dependent oxidoreductase [Rhizobium sp. BK376]|uniref:LLM class flavin-dependent oxidoreductase n=1 Tax=Rhizobium sp. BK376 TaxID=2512149 RepID=UPI0010515F7B|nr:LLM class flavin-dependent oxidoreductase [Rhizobium sp. BK376]TCR71768.1 FMN-dependent oxidoreductase (nitrilotriacetate monooxygenase family) [Rhizobium sp. BK376]
MLSRRPLVLAPILGSPAFSWRNGRAQTSGDLDISLFVKLAQTAERGKLDAIFLGDSFGIKDDKAGLKGMEGSGSALIFESITLVGALAMATKRIGLAATVSTSYNHPFSIARQIASIDHMSGGRMGWNVVTSAFDAEAQNFGLPAKQTSEQRYERAREFVDVVLDLWDSWEDEAIIRDRASGRFFDSAKVHRLNHEGRNFNVRGPLNVSRSPQGRPVMFQAGTSEAGYDIAAELSDAMYVKAPTFEAGKAFYEHVKAKLPKFGRSDDELSLMPGLTVVTGTSEKDARDKFMASIETLRDEEGLMLIKQLLGGLDLSPYPVDEPIPQLPHIDAAMKAARMVFERRGRRMTTRELMGNLAANLGHLMMFGTPGEVAAEMIRWRDERAADGFILMSYYLPDGLEEFVDHVVPELQERGAFRTEYEGQTFREHLGLARPANRFRQRSMERV